MQSALFLDVRDSLCSLLREFMLEHPRLGKRGWSVVLFMEKMVLTKALLWPTAQASRALLPREDSPALEHSLSKRVNARVKMEGNSDVYHFSMYILK